MADDDELARIRTRIDSIDGQIQELLNERASCSLEVGRIKTRSAEDETPVFYRPEREAQILRKIKARNPGPLPADHVAHLFREIISSSLSLEHPLSVAYLGPEGTFTEAAAIKHFGHFAQTRPIATIDDIFAEVESGAVQFGVVPVENSTEGMVNHTLDCLMQTRARICGEVELPIHQNLMASAGLALDGITAVYSHEQSLAQTRGWLDRYLPEATRHAVGSNAEAAVTASSTDGAAAIGPERAAHRYGLSILAPNIEDHTSNTTRFLIVGLQEVPASGDDKCSILVSMHNRPGALYEILGPFNENAVSLTRLIPRPSRVDNWTYVFFIDFAGHHSDALIADVLEQIRSEALEVRLLGSYPRGVL